MALVLPYKDKKPLIHNSVFLAENSVVIGDVEIGEDSSVWYGTVIRGDVNYIRIGKGTNIQDNSVVHVTHDTHPTIIGDYVTVGHRVILHGCKIGNYILVSMGDRVLKITLLSFISFSLGVHILSISMCPPWLRKNLRSFKRPL